MPSRIEIFNGNPRHDSHNDLARAWQNRQGFPVLQARISIRCRICQLLRRIEKLPGDGQELAEVIRQGRFTREIFRGI